jgi:predicted AlkP superfamily pyrophosphatase or phosphodiesterase
MKRHSIFLLLSFCLTFGFGQTKDDRYVILISFDGFRSDYVERYDLPNFKKFIREGAAATGLIPSFPSKTFPNHYTIVTGLYPGNHGLVDNSFYDPKRREVYGMRIREAVINPAYYGGTPLWQLAKQQGLKSAAYFWVGSELKEEKLHPDYYYDYDQSVPFQKRVDQVIGWLNLPSEDRPRLITLYFSSPDYESHNFGPLSAQTRNMTLSLDSLLGNLMEGVAKSKLPVNVILVSDHGMSQMIEDSDTYIFMDELIQPGHPTVKAANGGTQMHVYTQSAQARDSVYNLLNKKDQDFMVIKREAFPPRWHYDNDRSGDLLVLARPGKYIVAGSREKMHAKMKSGASFGVHGYDPAEVKDMYGIFYANGPNIRPASNVPAFENIHIYPFIAEILQLKVPKIDGKLSVLKPILKNK